MRNATLLAPLSRIEKAFVGFFLLLVFLFGGLVLKRSAYMHRRMGDVGVYLRAGWAARAGGEHLYHLTCDNGWHYNYPSAFAVLMVPLADPPERDLALTASTTVGLAMTPGPAAPLLGAANLVARKAPLGPSVPGGLPYPASVVVFYLLNIGSLALGAHLLAGGLEHASGQVVPAGCRRWWWLRLLPVLVCLPPTGHSLMRGQVNTMLLLFVCGMAGAMLRRQGLRAGLWLAGAICLKLFPAYLLVVPLVRRDGRCFAGCALGLGLGLGVVPLVGLGPAGAVRAHRDLARVLVAPALHLNDDDSRAKELIEMTATDNVSFQTVIHNNLHSDRSKRPDVAHSWVRWAHLLLAAGLTVATLLAGWRHRHERGPALVLHVGALVLIMLLSSPVCHSHYFTLSVLIVMGLLMVAWERDAITPLSWWLVVLFTLQVVGNTLPLLPGMEWTRDAGLSLVMALALWATGCLVLARRPKAESARPGEVQQPLAA